MRYQNISGGSLLLPRENGRGGSLDIPKDDFFEGSSMYQKYVDNNFIRRVGQGTSYPAIQGSDPTTFIIGKRLIQNGLTAEAIDAATYNNAGVVSVSTSYTIFGKVTWYDAESELVDEVNFSVTGNGTHGSGSTFVFGTSAASTKPTATGSSIDIRNGTVAIKFDNGAPGGDVVLESSFDYQYAGEHLHYGDVGEAIFNNPNITTITVYVSSTDESNDTTNYQTGSAGQVKTIKTFGRGSQPGDKAKITTFRYRDSDNPTNATNIDISDSTVTVDDLQ